MYQPPRHELHFAFLTKMVVEKPDSLAARLKDLEGFAKLLRNSRVPLTQNAVEREIAWAWFWERSRFQISASQAAIHHTHMDYPQ